MLISPCNPLWQNERGFAAAPHNMGEGAPPGPTHQISLFSRGFSTLRPPMLGDFGPTSVEYTLENRPNLDALTLQAPLTISSAFADARSIELLTTAQKSPNRFMKYLPSIEDMRSPTTGISPNQELDCAPDPSVTLTEPRQRRLR